MNHNVHKEISKAFHRILEQEFDIKPLTEDDIREAMEEIDYPEINAFDYDDIMDFWDDVEEYFDKQFLKDLSYQLNYSSIDDFINDYVEFVKRECNGWTSYTDSVIRSVVMDSLLTDYNWRFVADAKEHWPEYYDSYPPSNYHCKVCGKSIQYNSKDSVMLLDDKWNEVLKFYNLVQYEKDAAERSSDFYSMTDRRGHMRLRTPQDCNTFICNDCIETALGHKILPTDINDSIFNQDYRSQHFKK